MQMTIINETPLDANKVATAGWFTRFRRAAETPLNLALEAGL
jgi:hypothetical protein